MFKKPTTHSRGGDNTFIAAECQISGSITINGNARIDGKIEGSVLATGDLVIGASAILKANIEANTVSIAGEVHGNIKTTDLLELNATARLFGDICTRQFKVDQGARFIGTSQILEETNSSNIHEITTKDSNSTNETKLVATRA
ncbi:polymer-forming cytoskeletal protein [Desulfosporosinus sp. OT]|uniref:bactofilin family protein n=1 Tax=Desulfosporosinus sp. OT TaxID=913865 RepID=UPI000223A9D2|nr:polymer-forming cytoskeletal protein [Desulfosporosinus sp. OT]EGW36335.1 hypothetical protein DOT_5841 [Desulfosporosinus sp. OT]